MGEAEIVLISVSLLIVLLCVGIHYEVLKLAWALIQRAHLPHRLRVLVGILMCFLAHVLEATLFAATWGVLLWLGVAELSEPEPDAVDILYFSFSTYTSLGYGDIVPMFYGRVLAGIEALLGLVLIAWTASFTYLEMSVNWRDDD